MEPRTRSVRQKIGASPVSLKAACVILYTYKNRNGATVLQCAVVDPNKSVLFTLR